MRILVLIENNPATSNPGLVCEHGLSLYIETNNHKIISDTGASGKFLVNASKLGVDLGKVDKVFLSHGHYDHTGGTILLNSKLAPDTPILAAKGFDESHFNCAHQPAKVIGIDRGITRLPNLKIVMDSVKLDDEIYILKDTPMEKELPIESTNLKTLKGSPLEMVDDDFNHEMYLVLTEGDKKVLISGCAHKGITNIVSHFIREFGAAPDVVVSGFHMKSNTPYSPEEVVAIQDTALDLLEMTKDKGTIFYTCHCTSLEAFEIMRDEMGSRIVYVRTGDEICV